MSQILLLGILPVRPRDDHPLVCAGAMEAVDPPLLYPQPGKFWRFLFSHRNMEPPKNNSLANFCKRISL
jgi:hypothetical protein